MIGFTPNEVPYKNVKAAGDRAESQKSRELDFDALWDELLDVSRDNGSDDRRHSRTKI